jgi:hypothetical protein
VTIDSVMRDDRNQLVSLFAINGECDVALLRMEIPSEIRREIG